MDKKVSIVICTFNRGPFLNRTLFSLKYLDYKNFEVTVVNGPSTDETDFILDQYKDTVKIVKNPLANLSVSRNLGIAECSGEIIAFIDDDAIPEKTWLTELVPIFDDETVGGAGGKVYAAGDDKHIQFKKGYVDIWGEGTVSEIGRCDYNDPNGTIFNQLMGTNCVFRRSALLQIGGFDEYFEYFFDETDVCVRIIQAGYKIIHHEPAIIYHEFAKSHVRQNTHDPFRLNWYPIIKNKVYFLLKFSQGKADNLERERRAQEIEAKQYNDYKFWLEHNHINKEEYDNLVNTCRNAYKKGYEDGVHKERSLNFNLDRANTFKPYDPQKVNHILSIGFLCQDDPIGSVGGVAKYTYELAKGLVKKGHIVHIITNSGPKEDYVDSWIEEGIGMHRIKEKSYLADDLSKNYPAVSEKINHSFEAYKAVVRIASKYGLDILESPIWDFEGVVAARLLKEKLPVVVRLQTPFLKVADTQHWQVDGEYRLFSELETILMDEAQGVIAISDHIKETISELYPVQFSDERTDKVFLGVDESGQIRNRKLDGKIRVLFVGRLERRKGIHTIYEVMPRLMKEYKNLEFRFVGNYDIKDEKLNMSYYQYFKKHYGSSKWSRRVTFLGQISNEEKDQEYANCDILLAPSLYESFGIILIEAMSAAKPVIGCKIGGMQEIILDGETGYTIGVENADQLYEKLKALISNPDLREMFGKSGYERFKKLFSNEAMVQNSLEVYTKNIYKFRQETGAVNN